MVSGGDGSVFRIVRSETLLQIAELAERTRYELGLLELVDGRFDTALAFDDV